MQLDDVAIFVRVVQAGSFTKAAATLGLTKSTVSLRVMALERSLGIALLQRTTRAMSLTNDGAAFFATSAAAIEALEAAAAEASHGRDDLRGVLRVTAPTALGAYLLPGFLAEFLATHPLLKLQLSTTNRFVDLAGEGVDVAIRAGVLADSTLVQRRVGTSCFTLYASRTYLKLHGTPKSPADLAKHSRLSFAFQGSTWKLARGKRTVTVDGDARIETDDLVAMKELAAAGLGIALIPAFVAKAAGARNPLVPVLEGWSAHETGVFIVLPPSKERHPRVRAFADAAAAWLARELNDIA